MDGSPRRDATGELLDLLLRDRAEVLDALDAVHAAAYAATDPRLLDVARSRAALLIGVSTEPVDPPTDTRERACADVVEQSVLDVTGVTDAQIAGLATHLGDDAAATFVTAALVIEQRLRMQAVFERLGLGVPT